MSGLNVARLTNKLRSLFVLRGETFIAPEVSDEVRPVVIIEAERTEHFFLAGELLGQSLLLAAAPPLGEFAYVGIRNAVDSGIVIVLELLAPTIAPLQQVRAFRDAAPFIASTTVSRGNDMLRDTRWGLQLPSAQLVTGANAALGGGVVGPFYEPQPEDPLRDFVLGPGQQVLLFAVDPDVALNANVRWRERPLEKSESA